MLGSRRLRETRHDQWDTPAAHQSQYTWRTARHRPGPTSHQMRRDKNFDGRTRSAGSATTRTPVSIRHGCRSWVPPRCRSISKSEAGPSAEIHYRPARRRDRRGVGPPEQSACL